MSDCTHAATELVMVRNLAGRRTIGALPYGGWGAPVRLTIERCARCSAVRARVLIGTRELTTPWGRS